MRDIPPATSKQIAYLQSLEKQLGYQVRQHEHMPLWKAVKRITKLKARLDENNRQTRIALEESTGPVDQVQPTIF